MIHRFQKKDHTVQKKFIQTSTVKVRRVAQGNLKPMDFFSQKQLVILTCVRFILIKIVLLYLFIPLVTQLDELFLRKKIN